MRTLFAACGSVWTVIKWLRGVKKAGRARLSVESAQKDRLALERIVNAMRAGDFKSLPRSLRLVGKWIHKLGLLDDLGTYGQALLKSEKLWTDDNVLYEYQNGKKS